MFSVRQGARGSAVVELVILLPVLVLVLLAMLYIGELSTYRERTLFGSEYALNTAGDQSESAAGRGVISNLLYPLPPAGSPTGNGDLTVVEAAPNPSEIPEPGEIREMFDEMSQPVYSTTASGHYVFANGQLRFVINTSQSRELSSDGRYAQKYRLLDNNIPELTTDISQGWIERDRVDLTYSYNPDYLNFGPYPLDPADVATRFQSVNRGGVDREVTNPPSGNHHQIETVTTNRYMTSPGRPVGYPDFTGDEPFWKPN